MRNRDRAKQGRILRGLRAYAPVRSHGVLKALRA